MKIIVHRQQKYIGFPRNKFEYSINVKVDFSSGETELLEKYKGWHEPIQILADNQRIKGLLSVNAKVLSKDGAEWSDELIYEKLSDIPQIIADGFKGLFGNYRVREQWGQANADEVIKVEVLKEKNS
jgi:hypothetical protein